MQRESSLNVATWVGSLAAAFSAIATAFAAYNWRLEDVQWPAICIAEAIVIGGLGLYILRKRPISIPRGVRTGNRKILESLFRSVSRDFDNQLAELSRSQLSLYGRQVRNAQVHLLEALTQQHEAPVVHATDIIQRIDIWPTRGVYLAANQRFIQEGGRTTRIFLIRSGLIMTNDSAKELWAVMEMHRAMGVHIGLHIIDVLSPEHIEDFVVYNADCVLVETEQGDLDFSTGKATVFFDPRSVELYSNRFDYLAEANDTKSADEVLELYRRQFVESDDPGTFAIRRQEFLRKVR